MVVHVNNEFTVLAVHGKSFCIITKLGKKCKAHMKELLNYQSKQPLWIETDFVFPKTH